MKILTYHKISDTEAFRAQVALLARHHAVISLQQFLAALSDRAHLDGREVMITFDDGDPSVLTNAMPVLKEFGLPAVLFVITELIGTTLPFWWDEVIDLGGGVGQAKEMKLMPNAERLQAIEKLRRGKQRVQYRQLNVQELRLLEQSDIAIANHSHTHPMFDQLSAEEISAELDASVSALKTWGFRHADVFAFPNGNSSPEAEKILRDKGIRAAFLFDHKIASVRENPMRISRLSVGDDTPLWKFKMILSGWHSRVVPITKRLHKLRS